MMVHRSQLPLSDMIFLSTLPQLDQHRLDYEHKDGVGKRNLLGHSSGRKTKSETTSTIEVACVQNVRVVMVKAGNL